MAGERLPDALPQRRHRLVRVDDDLDLRAVAAADEGDHHAHRRAAHDRAVAARGLGDAAELGLDLLDKEAQQREAPG
eukprot:scaffold5699_cov33-Phaeocystis_antarctica.AAC.2